MIKVGLVFLISNFFINKIALASTIWMSFSCSNLALVEIISLKEGKGTPNKLLSLNNACRARKAY
jgi:hypothetical protein